MDENKSFLRVLEEKPIVKVQYKITVAEQVIDEYIATSLDNPYVAVPFVDKVASAYKNTSALARMLGKMIKKKNLENVKVAKDEKNAYLLMI